MPRTFNTLALLGTASAFFTFMSVLLATIFAGIEAHPAGYPKFGEPTVLAVPAAGTTFVAGMNAFMNISYTFIGQITLPSFIAEMKNPKDFPKALWAVTIAEVILFSLVGSIIYAYTGTNYNTAPAFGSLGNETYKKVSFSFMIPTIIFLGVLYASVSARFIFFRIFAGTRHLGSHTVVGWVTWAAILAVTWVLAFIIAEVIPFFNDLLSLMSSLFDSFFGFIFWGVAYLRMRRADFGPGYWAKDGMKGYIGFIFNVLLICIGLLFLTGGTYVSPLMYPGAHLLDTDNHSRHLWRASSKATTRAHSVAPLLARAMGCKRYIHNILLNETLVNGMIMSNDRQCVIL